MKQSKLASCIKIFVAANLISLGAFAQNAREVTTTFDKANKTAFQVDYNAAKDVLQNVLDARLKKSGVGKGSKSKGFVKYEGVIVNEISANKMDFYTKVDGKKNNGTITMMVSTGYDNFISTSVDAAIANNTIAYLNNLKTDVESAKSLIDLSAQQKIVKKAEDKVNESEKKRTKLENQKAKLEKQIEAEGKSKEEFNKVFDKERTKLDNMKAQNDLIK